jgi:hypothetical protein
MYSAVATPDVMATFTAREPPSVDCRSNQRIHSIQPLAQRLFPPLQQQVRRFRALALLVKAFEDLVGLAAAILFARAELG